MNIAIHQSSFLPYIGYWNKLISSEIFFDLGSFQFSPNEMYHRTFIRDDKELKYLTVPVIKKPIKTISETPIVNIKSFNDSLKNVLIWYKKNTECYNWKNVYNLIMDAANLPATTLAEYNSHFIDAIIIYFKIKTTIIRHTPTNELYKSEKLIDIIQSFTKDPCTYFSGSGGKNYIDLDRFKENKIDVKFPTPSGDFFKGTILDYMMAYSPEECFNIINTQSTWS